MQAPALVTNGRGLRRFVAWLLVYGVAAVLGRTLFAAVPTALSGNTIEWGALFTTAFDTNDFYLPLFLGAFFTIELVQNGWQSSALRRVLHAEDHSTHTDMIYCIFMLTRTMPVIAIALTLGVSEVASTYKPSQILSLFGDLPLWLAVPVVLLLQSFLAYWSHRLFHTKWLWHIHGVHHSATDFNLITAARHHPFEWAVEIVTLPLVASFLGLSVEAITIGSLIVGAYAVYVHSELPTSAFLERYVAFGPNGHGIHHSIDPSCHDTNFSNLVIWDRLFGTYKVDVAGPHPYGCDDPENIYQTGRPLRDMIVVQAACARNLWDAARGSWRPNKTRAA